MKIAFFTPCNVATPFWSEKVTEMTPKRLPNGGEMAPKTTLKTRSKKRNGKRGQKSPQRGHGGVKE